MNNYGNCFNPIIGYSINVESESHSQFHLCAGAASNISLSLLFNVIYSDLIPIRFNYLVNANGFVAAFTFIHIHTSTTFSTSH